MPTCEKHRNPNYEIVCLCVDQHCCECEHPVDEWDKERKSYVPPEPNGPRWMRLSTAYHRMKWMDSSDAILFLDRFIEEEKQGAPLCGKCSTDGMAIYHFECLNK